MCGINEVSISGLAERTEAVMCESMVESNRTLMDAPFLKFLILPMTQGTFFFGHDRRFFRLVRHDYFSILSTARRRHRTSVFRLWHCGKADDRTFALHSFGNLHALQLNLFEFAQCLTVFDTCPMWLSIPQRRSLPLSGCP